MDEQTHPTRYPELATVRGLEAELNKIGAHVDAVVLVDRKVGDPVAVTGDGSAITTLRWKRWRNTPLFCFQIVRCECVSSIEHSPDDWRQPESVEVYSRARVTADGRAVIDLPGTEWHGRAFTWRYETVTPWVDQANPFERAATLPFLAPLLAEIVAGLQRQADAATQAVASVRDSIGRLGAVEGE
jgi:hypothetical protein